jgi:hypothetical protein
MQDLHEQSKNAFIYELLFFKKDAQFEAICYRMAVKVGWPIETIRRVFLTINRERGTLVYRYCSDNEKIKAAIVTHQKYLRSQLSK